ncbi:MAG: thioredoxin family protein [Flavobacteriaceae bacterium]|nr:thioredoxin family protein [Flavobacteriaceae bacterium]
MNKIIQSSLKTAQSYTEYKELILSLLKKSKSTGLNQNDNLLNFTKLNNVRMKRLDKQTKLSQIAEKKALSIQKDFTWLVLTESWCGDAAQTLPLINKFAEATKRINLKVVLRDDNDELMNQFLTNGSKSIPKLIVIENNTNKVIGTWGPRSKFATKMVNDYKEKYGNLSAEFKKELQQWYNSDKGVNIENEMVELIESMK